MRATSSLSATTDISFRSGGRITSSSDMGSSVSPRTIEIPDREHRIRIAFGLPQNARLPHVDRQSLQRYRAHLATALTIPFVAEYYEEIDPVGIVDQQVTVLGLPDMPECMLDPTQGLIAMAESDRCPISLRLADLKLDDDSANQQLIEDYWYWFWNWQ